LGVAKATSEGLSPDFKWVVEVGLVNIPITAKKL